jgi:outer membrane protein TolC
MQIVRYPTHLSIITAIALFPVAPSLAQTSPKPSPPNGTSNTTVPSPLNPSSNPLELPTKPDEVRLQETQSITLQQALDLAQRNNRELQVAVLTQQRSQAALKKAQAAQFPTLGIEGDLATERSATERLIDLKLGDTNTSPGIAYLGGAVGVNYNLFTSGKRSALIQAAKAQVNNDALDVERIRSQTYLNVTNAYYDLQEAGQQVRIAQTALGIAQQSLRDAEVLALNGSGAQFDVVRAQVQVGNAEQDLVQAANQQDIARRQLVQLLSLSEVAEVSAADPVTLAGQWSLSLEESIVLAYKNRVELQQQTIQQRISQQQRRAVLAETKPQVSLFANYQVVQGLDPQNLRDGYAAGAKLKWDFFDGGAAKAAAAQEEKNIAIAQTRFAETRNQIRFQVEQAYKNLQANARSIQTAQLNLRQAQQALEISRARFLAGVGTQLERATAQREVTQADVNRVRAILNYNRALAALQQATFRNSPLTAR